MVCRGEILPLVQQQVDVQLYVVGQKPHKRIETLRDNPAIEITGWVPAIQPYLYAADVYVAPLRMGSGTRLKLLEAMASGCTVVATEVAASGLANAVGEALHIANDAPTMAETIVKLLKESDNKRATSARAVRFIQENYDWSILVPRLLDVYKEIGLGQ